MSKMLISYIIFYVLKSTQIGDIELMTTEVTCFEIRSKILDAKLFPPGHTYWPSYQNNLPSILDFFLSSFPRHINFSVHNTNDNITSNHNLVILDIIVSSITPLSNLHY